MFYNWTLYKQILWQFTLKLPMSSVVGSVDVRLNWVGCQVNVIIINRLLKYIFEKKKSWRLYSELEADKVILKQILLPDIVLKQCGNQWISDVICSRFPAETQWLM